MDTELTIGTQTNTGPRSAGGKGCATVFFLVFLLSGLAFAAAIMVEAVRQTRVWFWPETPCTVTSSGVGETGDDSSPYRPSVRFEYEVDGRGFEGDRVSMGDTSSLSYDKARSPSDRYPAGSRASCRINPDDPGDAVLEPRLPWIALVVFFPLIFVAIGAGGIYLVWKGFPKIRGLESSESISQRAKMPSNLGRKLALGMGLIFAAVGGGLSIFLLVVPAVRLAIAVSWVETPATVEASTVRSWSTDDGMSHEADILYRYTAGDRDWLSNRRNYLPLSPSGYLDCREIVDRHPVGSETTCFVDPGDPSRSVMDRGFHASYLIGLFPLLFLLAGVGLIIHSRRSAKLHDHRSLASSLVDEQTEAVSAERVLEPDAGPVAKVIGILIFAIIWNGIVGIFVWQAVEGFRNGSPAWFMTVFLIPFVLVGLALVVGVFYTILAAFNPRPKLRIQPSAPRLGTRLRVNWEFAGNARRMSRLKLVLEGHERATYRRGTDTHTDREAFAAFDVVDTSADWEFARGTAEIEIPEDTMHSFTSASNAVVWSLHVQGDIARWPDVSEDFEIEVRPLSRGRLLP